MASVSGSQLAFFANGNNTGSNINLVLTPDGTGTLATVAGAFNIEVFTSVAGGLAPGFDASVLITGATNVSGNTLVSGPNANEQLLDGSFKLVDNSFGETIQVIGNGNGGSNDTVVGGRSDQIFGSTIAGNSQLIDGTAGLESIAGGAGNTTVWGGDFDNILGQGGPMQVVGAIGGPHSHMTIAGGSGDLTAFNFGTKNSITGSSGGGATIINDTYGNGGQNTLVGGSGPSTFIAGATGDLLVGGSGSLTVLNAFLTPGQTIQGGSGFGTQIIGGANDLIAVGSGFVSLVTALSNSTIFGGTNNTQAGAGTDVFGAGTGDSIIGRAGSLTVGGGAAANVTIQGGTGSLTAFNLGPNNSVVGSSSGTTFINDAYGAGGNDTLIGGGSATTIIAGANDSIVGKAGVLDVRILSNFAGTATVNLGSSAAVLVDANQNSGTVTGAGGAASVTGFNTSIDTIKTNDTQAALLATQTVVGGNVVLHFSDSTSMTIVGVSSASQITFIP